MGDTSPFTVVSSKYVLLSVRSANPVLPRRSGHRPFSVRSKSGLRRGNLHTMHAEVSPPPRSHSQSRMNKARSMPSVKLTQEARWCGTDGRLPHCSNLLSVVILLLQVIILLLYFAFHCTGKGKRTSETREEIEIYTRMQAPASTTNMHGHARHLLLYNSGPPRLVQLCSTI